MATIRHTARSNASPDAVWDILSRTDRIHEWYPALSATEITGENSRTVTLADGTRIEEVIVCNDRELRRQQYSITGGDISLISHLGTIDVIDLAPGALIVYSTEILPTALAEALSEGTGDATRSLASMATSVQSA